MTMRIILLAILAMLLINCSPKRRLNRLLHKHPELISTQTITIKDTVIKKDTLILKQRVDSFIVNTDTVIQTKQFIVEKKKDILKIITKQDTIYTTDTVYFTKEVPVQTIQKQSQCFYYFISFVVSVGIMFFLCFVIRMVNFLIK